jgi:hypothetical protein
VNRATPAELAAIAAAYAVLAARAAPPAQPQPSRWRQAFRPGSVEGAFARGDACASRWARAGRVGD